MFLKRGEQYRLVFSYDTIHVVTQPEIGGCESRDGRAARCLTVVDTMLSQRFPDEVPTGAAPFRWIVLGLDVDSFWQPPTFRIGVGLSPAFRPHPRSERRVRPKS